MRKLFLLISLSLFIQASFSMNCLFPPYSNAEREEDSCLIDTDFFEGFEGETFPPACWTVRDAVGNSPSPYVQYNTNYFAEGLQSFEFKSISASASENQYLITPQLNLVTNKLLSFQYRYVSSIPYFYVGVSYTGTGISDFHWNASTEVNNTTWRTFTMDIDPSVKYICIRFSGSGINSRYLYIDDFKLESRATSTVDFCNLETPATINAEIYQSTEVLAKIHKAGITNGTGVGANMNVWIGYGPQGTEPHTWSNWVVAQYSHDDGIYDVYKAGLSFPEAGSYQYVTRVKYTNTEQYVYGGYSASGGGFYNEQNVLGIATIAGLPTCETSVYDVLYMDFEGETFPPACWTVRDAVGNSPSPYAQYNTNYFAEGLQSFEFKSISASASENQYLITPQLNLVTNKLLSFQYRYVSSIPYFYVGVSYTGTGISDFHWNASTEVNNTTWRTFTMDIDPSVKYICIRFSGSGINSRYLYIDDFKLESRATSTVDFCNLESPATINAEIYQSTEVLAKVHKAGITNGTSEGANMNVWIGYGPQGTEPHTWSNWVVAQYSHDDGIYDVYKAGLSFPEAGNYQYVTRVKYTNTEQYVYGGYSASGGGFYNEQNVLGTATITDLPTCETSVYDVLYMGFEGETFPPACWTVRDAVGNSPSDYARYNTEYKYEGLQSFEFNSVSGTNSQRQYLITPELNLTTNKILSFRYRYSNYQPSFYVGVSYTGTNPTDFHWNSLTSATMSWNNFTMEIDPSVKYICIQFIASSNYYHLYIDDFKLESRAASTVDFCNLETPATISAEIYQSTEVLAKVHKAGITNGTGEGANMNVWIGYGPQGTEPHTWNNWVVAQYSHDDGIYDVYKAGLSFPEAGSYQYVTRVKYTNAEQYVYGGYSASGGGFYNEQNVLGIATIAGLPTCETSVYDVLYMDFEGETFPPACWTVRDAVGNSPSPYAQYNTSYFAEGLQSFEFNSVSGTNSQRQYLITPELNLTTNKILSFRYRYSNYQPSFYVGVSYTGTNPTDFHWNSLTSATMSWNNFTMEIDPSVKYICIQFIASSNYYHLYIDDFKLESRVASTVDFCNLESPATISAEIYQSTEVLAKVHKAGITNGIGEGANMNVWIGYGPQGTEPHTWNNWVVAQYSHDDGIYDVYKAGLSFPEAGNYQYVTRVKYTNTEQYVYGGYSASGGGFYNEQNVLGIATIAGLPTCETSVYDVLYMGFEGETFPPVCWTVRDAVGNSPSDYARYNTEYKYEGLQSFEFNSVSGTNSQRQYLITPELNLTTNKILSFRYRYSNYQPSFYVGVSYTGTNPTDFHWNSLTSVTTSWNNFTMEIDPSVKYICIQFIASSSGHYLYIDDFKLESRAASTVDFCNLESPATISAEIYQSTEVLAKVHKAGITNGIGEGTNMNVWIGYGPQGTEPHTWSNWVVAQYSHDDGIYDVYKAGLSFPESGSYQYVTRVKYTNTEQYVYGGYSASGGGFYNEQNVLGIATITGLPTCETSVYDVLYMGFEGETFPPVCWTVRDAVGNSPSDYARYNTEYKYEGLQSFEFYSVSGTNSRTQYLIAPQLNLGSNATLSFQYRYSNYQPTFSVGVSYTGSNTSDFEWNTAITPTTSFRPFTMNIDASVKYICIRFNSSGSGCYFYIDDFKLESTALSNPSVVAIDPDSEITPLYVCKGTPEQEAINALPQNVTLSYSDLTTGTVPLTWSITDYNANLPAVYNAVGIFELPSGINQSVPPTPLVVNSTVHVRDLPLVTCPANFDAYPNSSTTLTGATPAGGTYSGTGIVGNAFNTTGFETGNYPVTYSYTDPATGCSNSCDFTITVIKRDQTITFNPLPDKYVNDPDFSPGATTTSGLQISYTSSNPSVATIVNNQIHIVGAGSTTITASQSGNEEYNAAISVTQDLLVLKRDQTITFNPLSDKYVNDPDFSPGATSTSGLPISYSSSNLSVATIVNNQIHIVGAGSTTITASQSGNEEYNVAISVTQDLLVIKRNQTITFNPLPDKFVNDPDFSPGATSTSGLPISYSSSNLSVATIVNNQIHIVGVGSTTITASQPGNEEYEAAEPVFQPLVILNENSIREADLDKLKLYPNPTQDILHIETTEIIQSIELFDLYGKRVRIFSVSDKTIRIGDLASGMYLMKIKTTENQFMMKIVKE